jgi:HTH-type transcriptional regulator / antitoxin HigA
MKSDVEVPVSVGDRLREELDERGWTSSDFAEIVGRPAQAISEILNGKKEVTTDTAVLFEAALDISAADWLLWQSNYRLAHHGERESLSDVQRRARLRSLVPLAEIRRRGWLTDTGDLDTLEREVKDLLGVDDLAHQPTAIAMAAKRSNNAVAVTIEQRVWLAYVKRVAELRQVAAFDRDGLAQLASSIPRLLRSGPEAARCLREWFAECGVALVVVEGLRGGKLDGAATFVADRPVIGLTARGDRFDSFVQTLLHECGHLVLGHVDGVAVLDEDLDITDVTPIEAAANEAADRWLFPGGFPDHAGTTTAEVLRLADQFCVHPSIVIGRIQWQRRNFKLLRNNIRKIRDNVEMDKL